VLDQRNALRQIAAKGKEIESAKAYLFAPGEAWAIHNGSQNGTPLAHEDPQEVNPPAGVLAYYWLKSAFSGPLKLELVDSTGKVAVCEASDTPIKQVDTEAINVQAILGATHATPVGNGRYASYRPKHSRTARLRRRRSPCSGTSTPD
jgi:hypothetical protein